MNAAKLGNHAVDVSAVIAIGALAWAPAGQASTAALAGAISSVAVGKQYLSKGATK